MQLHKFYSTFFVHAQMLSKISSGKSNNYVAAAAAPTGVSCLIMYKARSKNLYMYTCGSGSNKINYLVPCSFGPGSAKSITLLFNGQEVHFSLTHCRPFTTSSLVPCATLQVPCVRRPH
jgi:hypothetical protein